MSSNYEMTPKFARGGIGDLLLCLQSAISAGRIHVYSHYAKAPDIFTPFGVVVDRFDYLPYINEFHKCFFSGEPLPTHQHPEFKMPFAPFAKPNKKVIGIHIEGSKFSNDFWAKDGKPSKNMSNEFLIKLVNDVQFAYPDVAFYIFCSPERLDEVGQLLAPEIIGDYYMIAFEKIWDSLACVKHCDFVIGMDSSIKTMSSILYIPTLTLVGAYYDSYRDATFLTPYVTEGTMNVIHFSNIDLVNPKEIIEYIKI